MIDIFITQMCFMALKMNQLVDQLSPAQYHVSREAFIIEENYTVLAFI